MLAELLFDVKLNLLLFNLCFISVYIANKSISPGPGTYVQRSMCFDIEKPKFYIGNKINEPKPVVNVPGAGSYEPNHSFSKKNLPSYSMKIKLGSCMTSTKGFIPGPGNY